MFFIILNIQIRGNLILIKVFEIIIGWIHIRMQFQTSIAGNKDTEFRGANGISFHKKLPVF
ncbi:hypothetical protein DK846_15075 [Methanospirillum lacunae]|uniref:Uncharacterized protein n=1 Tax=Methanospirillum lacunae TaxID=668570 RepID=A0A2V2N1L4_9EURY|nr:hypothetical protein DK846_15075 [Methanospirillum lacunae]